VGGKKSKTSGGIAKELGAEETVIDIQNLKKERTSEAL